MIRKIKYSELSLLAGIFLSIFFIHIFKDLIIEKKPLDEFALNENQKTIYTKINGKKIHCQSLNDLSDCLKVYSYQKKDIPVILFLGNSQLHTINDYQDGDQTSINKLFKYFNSINKYLITISQANANLQEHFLLSAYLKSRVNIKSIILPIVYDDLREDGLRPGIIEALDDELTIKNILSSNTGINLINIQAPSQTNIKNTTANGKISKNLEKKINEIVSFYFPLWGKRDLIRGKLYGSFYKIRNTIFGINAQTIRKKIPGRYQKNINALKDLIYLTSSNNIDLFIYIAPIRSDIKIPYDYEDYNKFKSEIENYTNGLNSKFANFENIISGNNWGNKKSTNLNNENYEFDFMHFTSEGHNLLADSIINFYETSLR